MAEGFVVRRGFIEPPPGQYQLIADVNVTSNTTSVDFTGLNITKEDELRLVYTLVGDSSTSLSVYGLRANDISTNYTRQQLSGDGSSLTSVKDNQSVLSFALSNIKVSGFADIKISNNDRFVHQSQFTLAVGSESSNIANLNQNNVNTQTITSINKLSVVSNRTNGIAVGSRLQLYKVVK